MCLARIQTPPSPVEREVVGVASKAIEAHGSVFLLTTVAVGFLILILLMVLFRRMSRRSANISTGARTEATKRNVKCKHAVLDVEELEII